MVRVPILSGHSWPQEATRAQQAFAAEGVTVLYGVHAPSWPRTVQRQEARLAVVAFLADYLRLSPKALRIPALAGRPPQLLGAGQVLALSFSYEQGIWCVACTRGERIGIDIVALRAEPIPQWATLAECYFSDPLRHFFLILPEHEQAARFMEFWCQNEAQLKMHGRALQERTSAPHFSASLDASALTTFETAHVALPSPWFASLAYA